jgi:hypothetical protein
MLYVCAVLIISTDKQLYTVPHATLFVHAAAGVVAILRWMSW